MNNSFKKKNVLVFGLGLNQGGVGSAQFFAKQGANVRVTDLKTEENLQSSLDQLKDYPEITYTLGEHKYEDVTWADTIIRNPAIKDDNPYLKYALEKGKFVETDFSIFLKLANQKKIIAITGTKGKSTTASLIYEAIKASGKKVVFAGNIGKNILSLLPCLSENPLIVVEISSFQLQALKGKRFAPKIAVVTNIYPDHLNWHTSMEEYLQAKKMIAINQTPDDFLLISCENIPNTEGFLQGIKSKIIKFCVEDIREQFQKYDLPLKGFANLENYAAAISVVEVLGIEDAIALRAFKNFTGGEFRMQLIGEFNGIQIINDSTATNPVATIEALRTLSSSKVILIAGGMNKGLEYHKLAAQIETYSPIKSLYLLVGDATKELTKHLRDPSLVKGERPYNNLEALLQDVKKEAKPGDIILFSPAATSFNLFQNEFDRGRQFNTVVKNVYKN